MTSQLIKKYNFNEVIDSQGVFRLLLEAMSNPSRIVNISKHCNKLFCEKPTMLALGLTLLDSMVTFCTCENRMLSDDLTTLTLSRRDQVCNADYIFVCNTNELSKVIPNAKCGSLLDPHKSATLIIENNEEPNCKIHVSGPGIRGKKSVLISEIVKNALELRDKQYYEYPQGIDLIFLDSQGQMFAIPRLVHWEA